MGNKQPSETVNTSPSHRSTMSSSYQNKSSLRRNTANHRFSNNSSQIIGKSSDFYIVGYTNTLFYDGINPGVGVTRVICNYNDVLDDSRFINRESPKLRDDVLFPNGSPKVAVKLTVEGYLIHKVVSGRLHTHLITSEGVILSFGSNNHGQLACGKVGAISSKCGLVKAIGPINSTRIIDGSAGGYHSLFISEEYKVFVVGSNSSQQCVIDTFEGTSTAIELPMSHFDNRKVISCSSGDSHSAFLTMCGKVYFAGSNSNGSCVGLKSSDRPLLLVNDLLNNELPIHISCGYDNSIIVTESGKALGAGCNSCGQLGLEKSEHTNFSDLRQLYLQKNNVEHASSGYFCSAMKSIDGEFFYSPGEISDVNNLKTIFKKEATVISIGVGDSIIWATCEENKRGENGKIYLHSKNSQTPSDVTGEFSLYDMSSQVEFSGQRDIYVVYFSGNPSHVIANHFMFLSQLVSQITSKGKFYDDSINFFSDISILIQ